MNYAADQLGSNSNLLTGSPQTQLNSAVITFVSGGSSSAAAAFRSTHAALCPSTASYCTHRPRVGTLSTAQYAVNSAVSINAQFAGVTGMGQGNEVDTHPGPCFNF